MEDLFKQGHDLADDREQAEAQDRRHDQENERHLPAHDERHDECEHQHQRAADRGADDHHVGHLHVGHVGGQAGHERGSGELVDVFKRIGLYLAEQIPPQVAGEPARRLGAGGAGQPAECQGQPRHHHQHQAVPQNHVDAAAALDLIDQARHDKRDDAFEHHLAGYQDRRQDRRPLEFADGFCQFS